MSAKKVPGSVEDQKKELETLAEGEANSVMKMHEEIAVTLAGVSKEVAEMMTEAKRIQKEMADFALQGKGGAAKQDDSNVFANKYVQDLVQVVRGAAAAGAAEGVGKSATGFKALAQSCKQLYLAGGNEEKAVELANKNLGEGSLASKVLMHSARKALGVDDASAGGYLAAPQVMGQVVPELLEAPKVLADVPRINFNGAVTMSYVDSGATTSWLGENSPVSASDISFGQFTLTEKAVAVQVAVSKRALRTVGNIESIIETNMRANLAADIDLALIRQARSSGKPGSLKWYVDNMNSGAALSVNATVSTANTVADIWRLWQQPREDNVPENLPKYLSSPRITRYLASLADGNNNLLFPNLMQSGLYGMPYVDSSQIPTNLAVTDTNESELYFYHAGWLLLGIGEDFRLEMSDVAAYNTDSSTLASAFSRDQMVFKIIMNLDFHPTYRAKEIAYLKDVDWGA